MQRYKVDMPSINIVDERERLLGETRQLLADASTRGWNDVATAMQRVIDYVNRLSDQAIVHAAYARLAQEGYFDHKGE